MTNPFITIFPKSKSMLCLFGLVCQLHDFVWHDLFLLTYPSLNMDAQLSIIYTSTTIIDNFEWYFQLTDTALLQLHLIYKFTTTIRTRLHSWNRYPLLCFDLTANVLFPRFFMISIERKVHIHWNQPIKAKFHLMWFLTYVLLLRVCWESAC